MQPVTTRASTRGEIFDLRKALGLKGMSVSDFARTYGHKEDTVHKIISRYWGTNRLPRGLIGKRILHDLQSAAALEEDEHEQEVSQS